MACDHLLEAVARHATSRRAPGRALDQASLARWALRGALVVAALIALALISSGFPHVVTSPLPTFLAESLGRPASTALPLGTVAGRPVEITAGGYAVSRGGARVGLTSVDAGAADWRSFDGGVSRPAPFGHETIIVGQGQVEEFLTVERAQGVRIWRWRLWGDGVVPQRETDGSVSLWRTGQRTGLVIPAASSTTNKGVT